MILVTAAYGTQGKLLIPRLAAAGARVRGLRASPGGERALLDLGAAEVLIGDVHDPKVLARAMDGVEAVYHTCPRGRHRREREMGFAVIQAAIDGGVKHFVYSSVLHPILTELIQHATKRDVEERLVSSPLKFTILQPGGFMQTLPYQLAFETGKLPMPWSLERRHSYVDVEDVAEVAATVLLGGEPHYGATYELSSADYTAREIGEIIGRVSGRAVEVVELAREEFMRAAAGRLDAVETDADTDGEARFQLRVLEGISSWYAAHDWVGNPNVLAMLLGRKPTTLEEFIRSEYERSGPVQPAA